MGRDSVPRFLFAAALAVFGTAAGQGALAADAIPLDLPPPVRRIVSPLPTPAPAAGQVAVRPTPPALPTTTDAAPRTAAGRAPATPPRTAAVVASPPSAATHVAPAAQTERPVPLPGSETAAFARARAEMAATDLASADFVKRMKAARTLVEGGEVGLDVLVARGGQMIVNGPGCTQLDVARPIVEAILESLPLERVSVHASAANEPLRRAAIAELARRRAHEAVPQLLAALDDPAPPVRAAAVFGLRELSGMWYGYDPDADVHSRRGAAAKWRQWWESGGCIGPCPETSGATGALR